MAAKKRGPKPKKNKPTVGELIVKTVAASKDRSGISLPELKKGLVARGYNAEKNEASVKVAIKRLVDKGTLDQVKGNSASRSFKMNNVDQKPKKDVMKAPLKAKKPVAKKRKAPKKPKRAAVKKRAATKKAAAKKRVAAKKAAAKRQKKAVKSRKRATKKVRATKKAQTSRAKEVVKPKAKKADPKKK